MNQPPIARVEEDREGSMQRHQLGRRPYLTAVPVVLAVVVVALLGVLGPRPAGSGGRSGATGSADASAQDTVAGPPSVSPQPSLAWPLVTLPAPSGADHIAGIPNIQVDAGDVESTSLGGDATPLAEYQSELLYLQGSSVELVDAVKPASATIAKVPPCVSLGGAALNATQTVLSEIASAGSFAKNAAHCPDWGSLQDWRVILVDVVSGASQIVASGTVQADAKSLTFEAPHVSIANNVYAFSRPDRSGDLASIEVYALPGDRLLARSVGLTGVAQVSIGDAKLAVVAALMPIVGDSVAGTEETVYWTDSWDSPLAPLGDTSGPLALSRDGSQLAFASCPAKSKGLCDRVFVLGQSSSWSYNLPSRAFALAADGGPLHTVAWTSQTSAEDPGPYIGLTNFNWPHPIALVGISAPIWVAVEGDLLMWVSVSPDDANLVLNEIDLTSAHVHP